ncbi:MAG TPA: VTT domain-containing protein [Beutenbergiaceae bacterium]|nr:VTT domain-containing protein [Beutenbergiaceae bacterium]
MSNFLSEGPFWAVFIVLFIGAMLRGQLLYWIGRIPTEQALKRTAPTSGWRYKVHRWLSDGGADAGVRSIQRWGLPIVSLCYLTVGFQSLVQAAAGMLRTPLHWYVLAQIPGALAWGFIYSTIGFAMWAALAAAAAGSPWGIAIIAAVLLTVVLLVVRRRRRRAPAEASDGDVRTDSSAAPRS